MPEPTDTPRRPFLSRSIRVAWAVFGRLARRPWVALALCVSMSLAGSIAYSVVVRWPDPRITDEFSHLLLGDTLRHFRLTNPPHPMWQHFETFHTLQQPTYASMYPPGQGFMLAVGWLLGGHPVLGVWLSGALMTAAVWWMLRGFFPPRWALIGALIAAAHFAMTKEWTQSYYGGCVPATGGALLAGALPRLRRRDRAADAWMLGLGLAILANTRPFEGIVVGIPALCVVVAEVVRRAPLGAQSLLRLVLPLAISLVLILGFMAVYNQAVVGDPLKFPYVEHQKQYCVAPPMVWLPPWPTPVYRHEPMRKLWAELHYGEYAAQRSMSGFLAQVPKKLERLWRFYLGWGLTPALIGLPWFLRRRFAWLGLASVLLLLLAALGQIQALTQYPSPGAGWIVMLVTGSLREIAQLKVRSVPLGLLLVIVFVLVIVARPVVAILDTPPDTRSDWRRTKFIAELEADGNHHLVVVRYGPNHSPRAELVWNEADIDHAGVVFARDMGPEKNQPLLSYFEDRTPWLLEVNFPGAAMRLSPYPK